MEKYIHQFAQVLQDVSTIIFHIHIIALMAINFTKTPAANTVLGRAYRGLEMLAGLLTPLAKR